MVDRVVPSDIEFLVVGLQTSFFYHSVGHDDIDGVSLDLGERAGTIFQHQTALLLLPEGPLDLPDLFSLQLLHNRSPLSLIKHAHQAEIIATKPKPTILLPSFPNIINLPQMRLPEVIHDLKDILTDKIVDVVLRRQLTQSLGEFQILA